MSVLRNKWTIIAGVMLPWLCVALASLILFVNAPPSTTRNDLAKSNAYLRGGAFLVLRLPATSLPVDQIQVFNDLEASRAFIPGISPTAFVTQTISASLLADLRELQQQWCNGNPRFDTEDIESYYEVALDCSGFDTPVFRVPDTQLPQPLLELVEVMPPAPTQNQ